MIPREHPTTDALRPTLPMGRASIRSALLAAAIIMVVAAAHQAYRRASGPSAPVAVEQTGAPKGVIRLD